MLDVQYRMHPSISRFPSSEFYNFSLHDGTVDSAGNILASLTPPSSSHLPVDASTGNRPSVVFLDHAGSESLKDRSRVNHNEANIVCSVVEDLLLQNEVASFPSLFRIAVDNGSRTCVARILVSLHHMLPRFHCSIGSSTSIPPIVIDSTRLWVNIAPCSWQTSKLRPWMGLKVVKRRLSFSQQCETIQVVT